MNIQWRRNIALVLILLMSFSTAFAAGQGNQNGQAQYQKGQAMFNDVADYTWGVNELQELVSDGMLYGYDDGSFKPDQEVTNLEAVAMIVRMMGWEETNGKSKFDLDTIPEWGKEDVLIASQKGVFDGIETFDPEAEASREEIAQFVTNAYGMQGFDETNYKGERYLDEGEITNDTMNAVYAMKEMGMMIGDHQAKFNPVTSVRRLEMAMIMHRHCHTHRHRNLTGQGGTVDTSPTATILIDDEAARYHISINPEITVEFSETVYCEVAGDSFSKTELEDIIEFEDDDDNPVAFTLAISNDKWEITPETLEYDTDYHMSFDGDDVVDADGNRVTSQTDCFFTTVEEGSVYVESIEPNDEAEDVAINTEVVIEFSEVVYRSDNPSEEFDDDDAYDAFVVDIYEDGSWEEIDEEDYSIEVVGSVWTITFDEPLLNNQLYRVDLDKSEIEDFIGEDVFTFETIGMNALSFLPTGDEVDVDEAMVLTFDEQAFDLEGDLFDATTGAEILTLKINGEEVDFELEVDNGSDQTVMTLSHGELLTFDAEYEVIVDESLVLDGVEGETTFEFSTIPAPYEVTLGYEDESEIVLSEVEGPYEVEGLEKIIIDLSAAAAEYCDDEGDLLSDLELADFVEFDADPEEDFDIVVNLVDEDTLEVLFRALDAGDYSLELTGIHYDVEDPEMYFDEDPMTFEFTLEAAE